MEVCPVCATPTSGESVCSACGFKMLGGTAKFKPVDISLPDIPLTQTQRPRAAYLHVVNGPQRGACYPLGDERLQIGRDPRSDIFLNDMTVSRSHAVLAYQDGAHVILDCNSFNGLWVNNENVEFARLNPGDKIQIGGFTLLYKAE